MYLKKNGKRLQTHSAATEEAYKKLGWKEFAEPIIEPRPPNLDKLSKSELLELAQQREIKVPMGATKADLVRILGE